MSHERSPSKDGLSSWLLAVGSEPSDSPRGGESRWFGVAQRSEESTKYFSSEQAEERNKVERYPAAGAGPLFVLSVKVAIYNYMDDY